MNANVAFIPLANTKCNSCGYLVGHAKAFHDNCHFTKGNANCPAKVFQIGVGVNVEKASQAIAEALHACDVEALQKHINRLATFKKAQTTEVLSLVFNKTALLYGIEISDSDEEDEDETEQDEQDAEDGEAPSDGQQGSDDSDEQQESDEAPEADADADADSDADSDDEDAEALTDLADDASDADGSGESAGGAADADDADDAEGDGSDSSDDDEDEWHADPEGS